MLSLDNLTVDVAQFRWLGRKRWAPLLHGISLDIRPGEMVALVGGSGKARACYYRVFWGYFHTYALSWRYSP